VKPKSRSNMRRLKLRAEGRSVWRPKFLKLGEPHQIAITLHFLRGGGDFENYSAKGTTLLHFQTDSGDWPDFDSIVSAIQRRLNNRQSGSDFQRFSVSAFQFFLRGEWKG